MWQQHHTQCFSNAFCMNNYQHRPRKISCHFLSLAVLVEPLIGCQFSELFSVSWDRVCLWLRGRNCFRWWSGSLAAGIGELRESSDELDFERLDKPRLWSLFLTQFSLSFSGVQASIFQSYHLKMCNWRMNKKSGLDSQYQPLILDFWPSSAAVTSLGDSEIKCWKWVSYPNHKSDPYNMRRYASGKVIHAFPWHPGTSAQ